MMAHAREQVEVDAFVGGECVSSYIGPAKRVANYARRANPDAELRMKRVAEFRHPCPLKGLLE